ncbi:MAG: ATP-binding protein [Deltaproteobacteria bacterium]|nr:ATP-binding protein [Deltaproteobacteria bacterium]
MLTIKLPHRIGSNQRGFASLANIYQKVKPCQFEKIQLDFQNTTWFDANMLAMLGAIMESAWSNEFGIVNLVNLRPEQEIIFKKTRFSYFGGESLPDRYQTTVEYRKSKVSEIGSFEKYLEKKLLVHPGLPNMSALLRKKIKESILEIFNNAKMHGNCEFVFSCGQYYPRKGRLDFTIVDIGNTIRKKVRDYSGREVSGKKAIEWAVSERTTTRRGDIPGGLGFTLIRDFLCKNEGKIQIASADGYWYEEGRISPSKDLNVFFGGTVVNLEFNVNDQCSYCLPSEIEDKDIPF